MAVTKLDLAQLETRLVKWMIATQLAVIGFLLSAQLALAALVIHLMRYGTYKGRMRHG